MAGSGLPELGPRRALIECADEAAARAAVGSLLEAGFEVEVCDGRGPGGRGCPLLRGERCLLVERAGIVLNALPTGNAISRSVLARTGRDRFARLGPSRLPGGAVSAARLLRARQARRLRRRLTTPAGRRVLIRSVRRMDASRLKRFDAGLGESSRRFRYLSYMPPLDAAAAARMAEADFKSRFAMVAVDEVSGEIVADCRLLPRSEPGVADLAIAVADDLQAQGVGSRLLALLLEIGRERGLAQIVAEVRYDNQPMIRLLRRLGFERQEWELGVITYAWRPAARVREV